MDENEEDIIEDEDLAEEQQTIREKRIAQLRPYQFQKGVSGNPTGRTPGESLKEFSKRFLACKTEDEKLEFMEGMNKIDIYKMAEGNPENKTDLTTLGESINHVDPTDPKVLEALKTINKQRANEQGN